MGVKRFVWDEVSDNVLLETDETDTVTARYCQRPERFGELLFQDRVAAPRATTITMVMHRRAI